MTDRDHFAAAALTGLLAAPTDKDRSMDYWARLAYEVADAMLRERAKQDTRPTPACGAPHAASNGDDGRPRDAGAATSHHAASGPGPELLSERLRIFADDTRLDAMPMKFRMTMRDAAREIERLHLTDAEREAIAVAMHRCDTQHYQTLRSLLERLK